MRYKTSGDISPQGLPKVYVTGHSAGFDAYLEEIREDLLKFSNCAVFNDPNPEHPENMETFFDDLESMQLIVLVVTTDFVEQDTFAFSHVFKFAQDHTIPVLPIQEGIGIEEAFNAKCGDLQMLNPHSQDITEISYEEKLKKFLDSKLIGDEMIQKIREAFDAYVFLSYRKKDRKYAQKLMRLIHSSDFCRDIAIWYDEFLVPGENFNKAIEEAMKKSELFALAVTPHLLEEGNYVMTTEYPAANAKDPLTREPAMKVMPVELVETDKQALQEKYEDIPSPISANDPERISETIRQALGLESTENSDPQHLLFIGLAYLSGIDVEVDRERAVKMITEAAEQDLPEAVDKLVSMYHDGDGVKRSFETAVKWKKRLVSLYEDKFLHSKSEKDLLKFMSEEGMLGTMYRLNGNFDEALNVYKKALSDDKKYSSGLLKRVVSRISQKSDILFSRIAVRAGILEGIGDIYEALGKLEEAYQWLEKSIKVAEKSPVPNYPFIINLYMHIGSLSEEVYSVSLAESWFELALNACKMSEYDGNQVQAQRGYFKIYIHLGNIYKEKGDFSGAVSMFNNALDMQKLPGTQNNTVYDQLSRSKLLSSLGDLYSRQGDKSNAKNMYLQALEIIEPLSEKGGLESLIFDICLLQNLIGNLYFEQEDYSEADQWYGKARMTLEKAEERPEDRNSVSEQRIRAGVYHNLGKVCMKQGFFDDAYGWYADALKILDKLTDDTDSGDTLCDLASLLRDIGNAHKAEGDLAEAGIWYNMAHEYYKSIAEYSDSAKAQIDLAASYIDMGIVSENKGDLAGAEENYEKALEIAEKLAEDDNTVILKRNLSVVYGNLGNDYEKKEEILNAIQCYEKKRKVEKIAEKVIDPTVAENTYLILDKLYWMQGDILTKREDHAAALEWYKKSLVIREKWASEHDYAGFQSSLFYTYCVISDVLDDKLNDTATAIEFLEKAIAIYEKYGETSEFTRWRETNFLPKIYKTLADVCKRRGDIESAEKWSKKLKKLEGGCEN